MRARWISRICSANVVITVVFIPVSRRHIRRQGVRNALWLSTDPLWRWGEAGPTLSAAYDEDVFAVKGYPQRMQIVYKQGVADDGDDTYHSMFPLLDDEAGGNILLFAPFHFWRKGSSGSAVSKMDITSWISSFGQL